MFKPLKPLFEAVRLPWKLKAKLEEKEKEIDNLENRIEQLEEEKNSWQERFEAEKERRSELARKKQEAEEERNRLMERLEENSERSEESQEDNLTTDNPEFQDLDFSEAVNALEKIKSVNSPDRDLATIYSPGELNEVSSLKTLKNSVSSERFSVLQNQSSFVAFSDPVLGVFVLKMKPFFDDLVKTENSFEVGKLLQFLKKKKHWCLVSAGETGIYREENGSFEQVERITNRVDREHSKGGFSQGRFERKRDEQIEQHKEQIQEKLEAYSNVYLIGDKRLCKDLDGKYLGGFNPNRSKPEQFYSFRFCAFF